MRKRRKQSLAARFPGALWWVNKIKCSAQRCLLGLNNIIMSYLPYLLCAWYPRPFITNGCAQFVFKQKHILLFLWVLSSLSQNLLWKIPKFSHERSRIILLLYYQFTLILSSTISAYKTYVGFIPYYLKYLFFKYCVMRSHIFVYYFTFVKTQSKEIKFKRTLLF